MAGSARACPMGAHVRPVHTDTGRTPEHSILRYIMIGVSCHRAHALSHANFAPARGATERESEVTS